MLLLQSHTASEITSYKKSHMYPTIIPIKYKARPRENVPSHGSVDRKKQTETYGPIAFYPIPP